MMTMPVHMRHRSNATSSATPKILMLASVKPAWYKCPMKLLIVLGALAAGYLYVLLHTTNIVLKQTQQLNAQYQYVADHADQIAAGQQP